MLSVGKIFWLIIILISVWYLFKIIEKRKLNTDNNSQNKENDNDNINKKGIDAFKCDVKREKNKLINREIMFFFMVGEMTVLQIYAAFV